MQCLNIWMLNLGEHSVNGVLVIADSLIPWQILDTCTIDLMLFQTNILITAKEGDPAAERELAMY